MRFRQRENRPVGKGPIMESAEKTNILVTNTLLGKGVRLFEERDKQHFIRVEPGDWQLARQQLEQNEE